jgi:hypothetical protein
MSGYSDDSFEDERDYSLQSVMPFPSGPPADPYTSTADFDDKVDDEGEKENVLKRNYLILLCVCSIQCTKGCQSVHLRRPRAT